MRLKRFLAAVLSAVMVMNTLSEPLTSMAMDIKSADTEPIISEQETEKFSELIKNGDAETCIDILLFEDNFYKTYGEVDKETRKQFLNRLTDDERYEIKMYAKYELINAFVNLEKEPKEDDVNKVSDYAELYMEIVGYKKENSKPNSILPEEAEKYKELDEKICKKLSEKYKKEFQSYDSLNDYLQTLLPIDIKELLIQIDTLNSVEEENISEIVVKFKEYALSVYGFSDRGGGRK